MEKEIKTLKTKYLYLIKENFFDLLIYLGVFYYIIKYKVLSITLAQDLDILPNSGWPRREHLVGQRLVNEPFFMGGAYSGSIDNFNLGPIPFN